ncbi:MAG: T9SS type A sorting domain-containing protein, partial [Bacteroidetes bacterium]|nr:T9SS type A sorting domain-containing protein [Bacteroidota bacterium]
TDANGCVTSSNILINAPDTLTATIVNSTNANCFGTCSGSATVRAEGGITPYTFSWAPSGGTDSTATGLCAGTNTVTVTDTNGCVAIDSVTLSEPALMLNSSVTNASCNGSCDGSVILSVSGGTAPYAYLCSWDPWGWCNSNNLCAGNYTVTITDSQGCTITDSIIITEPDSIFITSIVDAPTLSNNDGAIDLTVTGGTPPYAFLWDNGAATEDIDSLAAGTYQVVVTDSLDCIDSLTIQVPQPTGITETNLAGGVKIYPNPFTIETTIILTSLNKYKSGVVLSLYDILGCKRNIFYTVDHKINDAAEIRLKRGDLPAGIYFYSIRAGEKLISNGKLIVQ